MLLGVMAWAFQLKIKLRLLTPRDLVRYSTFSFNTFISSKFNVVSRAPIPWFSTLLYNEKIHISPVEREAPWRLVSTQENKHRIGSDWTFTNLYYPHRRTKKVENTSTFSHRIIGSNWNRKFVPKAHARVQFCSDPVRSHAYFPEWKPALSGMNYFYVHVTVFIPSNIPPRWDAITKTWRLRKIFCCRVTCELTKNFRANFCDIRTVANVLSPSLRILFSWDQPPPQALLIESQL